MNVPAPRDVLSEIRADHSHHSIGGGSTGPVVLAEVPADWRIVKRQGKSVIVRPIAGGGDGVVTVMEKRYALPEVWAIFEAALTGKEESDG